ncbi:protein arginine N-methyltransferase 7 [Plakobranchus ocellatus]|uniref:Protein arginine N-methyltransferase 7 n=1 Tax=Plakobranchus ocellatus TaxID=259542 RepID=A0AAV3YT48_9GAST|nr:protein arginine N-methyltransferase 7 [Plakobranchus ocellatus]
MADYDTESSDGSDEDSSSETDYGKSVQLLGSKQSSWAYILLSIKNSQNFDFYTVLTAAQQSFLCMDFSNAIKLFAVVFDQRINKQWLYTDDNSSVLLPNVKAKLLESQEMLTVSITRCCAVVLEESEQEHVDQLDLENIVELKQSLHAILMGYNKLGLETAVLLSQASAFYLGCKEYETALSLSERAVVLDPLLITAQEVHENICCHLVERWHFVMLNDKFRNSSYERAILRAIDQYSGDVSVCDVGCGSGLLSLIASKHPSCHRVYAVEKMSTMVDIAKKVFEENICPAEANKIKLINKMSSKMSIPSDLSKEAHILVTETFDAGLFGEGILPTLCHAWSKLLSQGEKTKSVVIPSSAKLYVQAIESEAILEESRLKPDVDLCDLQHTSVCIYSTVGMCTPDPYTTHDLKQLPGGYRTLSDPLMFMEVNFNDPKKLSELNNGKLQHFSLDITRSGRLDALAVWFSLCLLDDVEISTHTECNSCWEQAIFPVNSCSLKEKRSSLDTNAGDVLRVTQFVKGAQHCLSVTDIFRLGEASAVKRWLSSSGQQEKIEHESILTNSLEWCKKQIYCLSSGDIATLNDSSFHQAVGKTLREISHGQADFIHLNTGFSPFCLQALKMGYRHAWTTVHSPLHQVLTWKLGQENGTDLLALSLVQESEDYDLDTANRRRLDKNRSRLYKHVDGDTDDGGADAQREGRSTQCSGSELSEKCVLVLDVVDWHGRLVEDLSEKVARMRKCVLSYREARVVPHRVDVWAVLIDSEELLSRSRVVSNDRTLGYNIGKFVNRFSTRNHQSILLESLPHSKLCKPFKMFTLDLKRLVLNSTHHYQETESECKTSIYKPESVSHTSGTYCPSSTATCTYNALEACDHQSSVPLSGNGNNNNQTMSEKLSTRCHVETCDSKRQAHTQTNIAEPWSLHQDTQDGAEYARENSSLSGEGGCSLPKKLRRDSDGADDCENWGFNQSTNLTLDMTTPGTVTALVYWFDLHLSDQDTTTSTSSLASADTVKPMTDPGVSGSALPESGSVAISDEIVSDLSSHSTINSTNASLPVDPQTASPGLSCQSSASAPTSASSRHCLPISGPAGGDIPSVSSSQSLSTVSTLNPVHHWQQAAIMCDPGKPKSVVAQGDQLRLHCIMGSSAFRFWILD